jgi:hypothetical protein
VRRTTFVVAVATEAATIDDDTTETPLDLHRKASRLLAENAALVLAEHDGVADIENLG